MVKYLDVEHANAFYEAAFVTFSTPIAEDICADRVYYPWGPYRKMNYWCFKKFHVKPRPNMCAELLADARALRSSLQKLSCCCTPNSSILAGNHRQAETCQGEAMGEPVDGTALAVAKESIRRITLHQILDEARS